MGSFVGVVVLAALLCIGPSRAETVRPVNLEEMTVRAATIFSGRCLGVEVVDDAELGSRVVEVTFHVDRAAKGNPGATYRIRLLRDDAPGEDGRGPAGQASSFRPGEEVVLFLYGANALGVTSPVAMGQGRFEVLSDKRGEKMALNALGNAALWRGLTPDAAARLEPHRRGPRSAREVAPDALLDMVEALRR
jgi:hypothetical protein